MNPVGLMEIPEGFDIRPRRRSAPVRLAAAGLLLAFGLVATATTVASLGRYCLTSEATSPSPLQRP